MKRSDHSAAQARAGTAAEGRQAEGADAFCLSMVS
jgi:hypothetical protein